MSLDNESSRNRITEPDSKVLEGTNQNKGNKMRKKKVRSVQPVFFTTVDLSAVVKSSVGRPEIAAEAIRKAVTAGIVVCKSAARWIRDNFNELVKSAKADLIEWARTYAGIKTSATAV